jgi:hypothetical protein
VFSHKKILIIYVLVLAASAAGLYFYNDLFSYGQNRDYEKRFAEVQLTRNETKISPVGQLNWSQLSKEDFLMDGDKIYTGPESSVELKTITGELISIIPESLIQITDNTLNIKNGMFSAALEKDKPFQTIINDDDVTIYPFKNSKIDVEKSENGSSFITVQNGNIEVRKNAKSFLLKAGQKLKVSNTGKVSRMGLKQVELTTELFADEAYCAPQNILLKWKTSTKVDSYQLEFYGDANKRKKILSKKIKKSSYLVSGKVLKNPLYLSIQGFYNKELVAELNLKRVIFYATSKLPTFELRHRDYLKGENFQYSDPQIAELIANDDNYKVILTHKKSGSVFNLSDIDANTQNLLLGSYSSEACFDHPACPNESKCLKGDTFSIRQVSIPIPIYPIKRQVIYTQNSITNVNFKWEASENAKYKNIKITVKDLGTADINVKDFQGENKKVSSLLFNGLGTGSYSWKISGIDGNKDFVTKEERFSIVKTTGPKNLTQKFITHTASGTKYRFSWKQKGLQKDVTTYLETVAGGVESRHELNSNDLTKRHITHELPTAMKYQWRLKGIKKSKVLYQTSWKSFSPPGCKGAANLTPKLVSYDSRNKKLPEFSWSPVYGAKRYVVKIFQFQAGSLYDSEKITLKTSSTSIKWKKPKKDKFKWTVTPFDAAGNTCETSSFGDYVGK